MVVSSQEAVEEVQEEIIQIAYIKIQTISVVRRENSAPVIQNQSPAYGGGGGGGGWLSRAEAVEEAVATTVNNGVAVEVEATTVADPTLAVEVVTSDKMVKMQLAVVVVEVLQELLLMVGLIDTHSQVVTTETSVEQKTTKEHYVTTRY